MSFVDELQIQATQRDQEKKSNLDRNQVLLVDSIIKCIKFSCLNDHDNLRYLRGVYHRGDDDIPERIYPMERNAIVRNLTCDRGSSPKQPATSDEYNTSYALLSEKQVGDPSDFSTELSNRIKELGFEQFKVELIDVHIVKEREVKGFFGKKIETITIPNAFYVVYVDLTW